MFLSGSGSVRSSDTYRSSRLFRCSPESSHFRVPQRVPLVAPLLSEYLTPLMTCIKYIVLFNTSCNVRDSPICVYLKLLLSFFSFSCTPIQRPYTLRKRPVFPGAYVSARRRPTGTGNLKLNGMIRLRKKGVSQKKNFRQSGPHCASAS